MRAIERYHTLLEEEIQKSEELDKKTEEILSKIKEEKPKKEEEELRMRNIIKDMKFLLENISKFKSFSDEARKVLLKYNWEDENEDGENNSVTEQECTRQMEWARKEVERLYGLKSQKEVEYRNEKKEAITENINLLQEIEKLAKT